MQICNRWVHFYVGRDFSRDIGWTLFFGLLPRNNPSLPKGWFKPSRTGEMVLFVGPTIEISFAPAQRCGVVWWHDYRCYVNSGWWTGRDTPVVRRRASFTAKFKW